MKRISVLSILVLLFSLSVYSGPDGGAGTAPNFTGTWKTNWGTELIIELTQNGDRVKGKYTYTESGVEVKGRIFGKLVGSTLSFRWREKIGERRRGGRGKFTLSGDGNSFTGSWGNGNSDSNGGSWNGERTGA